VFSYFHAVRCAKIEILFDLSRGAEFNSRPYIVGLIMKEWKHVQPSTNRILMLALFTLFIAAVIIAFGSSGQ
jgi:hypothetical protein